MHAKVLVPRTLVNSVRKCLSPQQVYIEAQYLTSGLFNSTTVAGIYRKRPTIFFCRLFRLHPTRQQWLPAFCLPLSLSSIHVAGLCSPILASRGGMGGGKTIKWQQKSMVFFTYSFPAHRPSPTVIITNISSRRGGGGGGLKIKFQREKYFINLFLYND
jgi:hypothetical protein